MEEQWSVASICAFNSFEITSRETMLERDMWKRHHMGYGIGISGLVASILLSAAVTATEAAKPDTAKAASPPRPTVNLVTKADAVPASSRAVEITFLKSLPGKREQLEKFIRANWFPPDEIAVEQGLMVSYEWLDSGDDASPWNAMVVVTYPNAEGFAGAQKKWTTLLADYQGKNPRVLIDGMDFRQLGSIVESKKLYERAPLMTKRSKLKGD
jgi:hypothetical protein